MNAMDNCPGDEKIERISELLDELVLDAVLRVLQCVWDTNAAFEEASNRQYEKTKHTEF